MNTENTALLLILFTPTILAEQGAVFRFVVRVHTVQVLREGRTVMIIAVSPTNFSDCVSFCGTRA